MNNEKPSFSTRVWNMMHDEPEKFNPIVSMPTCTSINKGIVDTNIVDKPVCEFLKLPPFLKDNGLRIEFNKTELGDTEFSFATDKYYSIGFFREGLATAISRDNHKCGFINKKYEEVIPFIYDATWDFSEGLAAVMLNHKWGFINKEGKDVIPCIYDDAWNFHEGLAAIEIKEKYGFIDKAGKLVIPCKYRFVGAFDKGLSKVFLNNKYGFINKEGKEIIPCKYINVENFNNGLAEVKIDNKWGLLTKKCKEIIPCIYDEIHSHKNGYVRVELNSIMYFIDLKNPDRKIPFINRIVAIGSRLDNLYFTACDIGYILSTGCFIGTLKQFKKAVIKTHNKDSEPYKEYMNIINKLERE